jgi:hypothetical protein
MLNERGNRLLREVHGAPRPRSLRFHEHEAGTDLPLEGTLNGCASGLQINVFPLQAKRFAESKARGQEQSPESGMPILRTRSEEYVGLFRGQRAHLLPDRPRDVHGIGCVPDHQSHPNRLTQGAVQDRVCLFDATLGEPALQQRRVAGLDMHRREVREPVAAEVRQHSADVEVVRFMGSWPYA